MAHNLKNAAFFFTDQGCDLLNQQIRVYGIFGQDNVSPNPVVINCFSRNFSSVISAHLIVSRITFSISTIGEMKKALSAVYANLNLGHMAH